MMITILMKRNLQNLIHTQNLNTGKTESLLIQILNKTQKITLALPIDVTIMKDITAELMRDLQVPVMQAITEPTTTDRATHRLEVPHHEVLLLQVLLLTVDIQLTAATVIQDLLHIKTILEALMAVALIPTQVQKAVT